MIKAIHVENQDQTIWIARHGNRLDFVNPNWIGKSQRYYDPPLSEDGIIQAKNLGFFFKDKNITHIFASPFLRTIETAYYVAEALDLKVNIEPGLCEFFFPLFIPSSAQFFPKNELEPYLSRIDFNYCSEIKIQYPEITLKQLNNRTQETLVQLLHRFSGNILLISHEATIVSLVENLVLKNVDIDASDLCCLFSIIQKNKKYHLIDHEYIPNPLIKSPRLSLAYFKNQLKQRIKKY